MAPDNGSEAIYASLTSEARVVRTCLVLAADEGRGVIMEAGEIPLYASDDFARTKCCHGRPSVGQSRLPN
jgi:hypothetical protein